MIIKFVYWAARAKPKAQGLGLWGFSAAAALVTGGVDKQEMSESLLHERLLHYGASLRKQFQKPRKCLRRGYKLKP